MTKEFRQIVRIAGTSLDGDKTVPYALTDIMGVGVRLSNVIVNKAGINPATRLGFLSDGKIEQLEEIIENPTKYGVPGWFLNRRKDRETGRNRHLIGSDIVLQKKYDIDHMINIRSWKGFRHAQGLKVRGQRTRTTGRSKSRAVGVRVKRRRGS